MLSDVVLVTVLVALAATECFLLSLSRSRGDSAIIGARLLLAVGMVVMVLFPARPWLVALPVAAAVIWTSTNGGRPRTSERLHTLACATAMVVLALVPSLAQSDMEMPMPDHSSMAEHGQGMTPTGILALVLLTGFVGLGVTHALPLTRLRRAGRPDLRVAARHAAGIFGAAAMAVMCAAMV
jgi:hypothetical protein